MNVPPLVSDALCPECERIFAASVERCPYDGARLVNLNAGLAPGTVIDNRYTLKRLLGRGGMGSVYLARQHSMDRDVAVKIMHHRADGDHSAVQRFFWEVRAARRLQSPHTITVYDFGQTERGSLYLTMELLKGMTLARRLSLEGRLSVATALSILVQICRSLEEAHAHNIIHRDLKPENIFLSRREPQEDLVKVLDFGVAKFLDPDSQLPLTKTGTVFGTPRYMSPEQASSESVDPRSDLYSLGVILYEMLTGRTPFAEASPLELLNKHVHALPPPLSEHLPGQEIDVRLEALVNSLLAKNREDRPSSARTVRLNALLLLEEFGDLPQIFTGGDFTSDTDELRSDTSLLQGGDPTAAPLHATPPLGMASPTPQRLLGRDNELAFARSALERAFHRSEPIFLWLSGEAGIGKQRFTKHLVELARLEYTAHVATGVSLHIEDDGQTALRLLIEGLLDSNLLESQAIRELLTRFLPEESELNEHLLAWLRPPLHAAPAEPTPHLLDALVRFTLRLSARRPLCLDLGQLAPHELRLRFLERLAATALRAVVPLIVLIRVPNPPGASLSHEQLLSSLGWKGERDARLHHHLQLKRLQADAFRDFCSSIGRGFSSVAPYLHYVTGGHTGDAHALIEMLEALPSHLDYARAWTPWSLQPIPAEQPCSLTERAALPLEQSWNELSHLAHAELILVYMALLGERFHLAVLEHALELKDPHSLEQVDKVCQVLVRRHILVDDGIGQLRFISGMARELILANLRSPYKRRQLHATIAYALEMAPLVGDSSQRELELAAHWEAAQAYEEALRHRLRYAQQTHAQGERELSLQGYLQALELLETKVKPKAAPALSQRLEVLLKIANLRLELSSYQLAADAFTTVSGLAQSEGAALTLAEAELGLARCEEALTEYGAACKRYLAVAERFIQLNAPSKAAHAEFKYAQCLERRGDLLNARQSYEKARKRFAQLQEQSGLAMSYHALGQLALQQGDSVEALRLLRRATDLHATLESSPETARVFYDLALAASACHEHVLAREAAAKALHLYEQEEHHVGISLSLFTLARALLAMARPIEARAHLERALHVREELGDRRGVAETLPLLAKAALTLEHPERARELAQRARDLNLQLGEITQAAQALLTLAAAEHALKRPTQALSVLREAIAHYRSLPLRDTGLVQALVQLSELQRELQLFGDALASLQEALSLARELKLSRETPHLEARLRTFQREPRLSEG